MDLHRLHLFIGLLIEEDYNRNHMRVARRHLRDTTDPFQLSDNHFKRMFRLNKQSVQQLINALSNHLPAVAPYGLFLQTKVFVTLHFLAVGSYQNPVGLNAWLSVSQTSVSRAINEICLAIIEHLLPTWIKFPTTNEAMNAVKEGFYRKYRVRGVLGAIDGTHVGIIAPPITDENYPPFTYINRRGKHTINVMLISDANSKILSCTARFPGSVHDSAIWQVSRIRAHLRTQYENGDHYSHLIGDSGYPLEPWLFTQFLNPQNEREENFNASLRSARNVIERTNGLLKGRFRCLSKHRTLHYHPTAAARIIYAGCVLHNMALAAGLNLDENEIELPEVINEQNNEPVLDNNILQLGRQARLQYMDLEN